jgi:hypothetical protein
MIRARFSGRPESVFGRGAKSFLRREHRFQHQEIIMTAPNFYQFEGKGGVKISWYPKGRGGPIKVGGPPGNAPVLIFQSTKVPQVTLAGAALTVTGGVTGTYVQGIIEETGLPGAFVAVGVLIPDVVVGSTPVKTTAVGILSDRREVSDIGPGQLEKYSEFALDGTASVIILPD